MKKVVTIGGGNGHSTTLKGIRKVFAQKVYLSSIVSMSDDGRTTGKLMRLFESEKGMYFPPPGDVRKCLYALSGSRYAHVFELLLESTFSQDAPISQFLLKQYFIITCTSLLETKRDVVDNEDELRDFLKQKGKFYDFFIKHFGDTQDIKLDLRASIEGHKMGNILMAALYTYFGDFNKMVEFLSDILKVEGQVIPVTLDKAMIRAILDNGEIIESQDAISNVADYTGKIQKLELSKDSEKAYKNPQIDITITQADYIIITPGDLYTSTIANLIIGGVKELIKKSKAKIIFIGNSTNKGGETNGYDVSDFVFEIEKYLGKPIDILIVNNKKFELTYDDYEKLKENISVKGGSYIYLSPEEKKIFKQRGIKVIEAKLLDRKTLYKHNSVILAGILEKIIF